MPTPFYHLWIAQDLLEHSHLGGDLRRLLVQNQAAFFFGNTAPDVQVVSRQPRQSTHFFTTPLQPGQIDAVQAMLGMHPQLASVYHLPAAQAAFLAGYLCHLQADWLWVQHVFDPIFGAGAKWAPIAERLYIHNVLRAYQDRSILSQLDGSIGQYLEAAVPDHWLPFVEDRFLIQWRDYLYPQLEPNAAIKTVEVFAERQGIPAVTYYHLLDSKERMEQEVFIHLSPQQMEAYRTQLLVESAQLLRRYLEPPNLGAYRQASAGAIL